MPAGEFSQDFAALDLPVALAMKSRLDIFPETTPNDKITLYIGLKPGTQGKVENDVRGGVDKDVLRDADVEGEIFP